MVGNVITKKDLEIFRGTYNEVMAQDTVNMKIYLAWDTQEIYIGNTVGQKIQYGVPKTIYRRVDEKYLELESKMDDAIEIKTAQKIIDETSEGGRLYERINYTIAAGVGKFMSDLYETEGQLNGRMDNIESLLSILNIKPNETINLDFGDDEKEEGDGNNRT